MKVYLSGGMRSNWQSRVMEAVPTASYINPRMHDLESPPAYTAADLFGIKMADVLFCFIEESNPSGVGAALEVGYAKALGKTVIVVNEKIDPRFHIVERAADISFCELTNAIAFLQSLERFAG